MYTQHKFSWSNKKNITCIPSDLLCKYRSVQYLPQIFRCFWKYRTKGIVAANIKQYTMQTDEGLCHSLIQSTLIISNSLISNNHLSRSENLVPVLTQRSTNRQQNIVEKRSNFSSFPQYFQYIPNLRVKLKIHSVKGGCSINCFP